MPYARSLRLSYTQFEYTDLEVDVKPMDATVSLQVKNVGQVAGAEVVQAAWRSRLTPASKGKHMDIPYS